MTYEFDANPEQLAIIIKQIRERSDAFSAPEIRAADDYSNDVNSSNSGLAGGYGGGARADGSALQQQVTPTDSSGVATARDASMQQRAGSTPAPVAVQRPTSPAARSPKQHMVFVLNVVDRLPLAADRAIPPPAPAPAGPAKQ
jgi:hypothetical protein